MTTCTALIVAGGTGQRFGAERPKQYLDLAGKPILRRTVEAFLTHPAVSSVRVVIDPAWRTEYDQAVAGLDLPPPITGGATRQELGAQRAGGLGDRRRLRPRADP